MNELPINQLIYGDTLGTLKQMPSEFIDCVITSPPYYGLRDYGIEGQIGLEKTPEEYVQKMKEIFKEIFRVMKKTGTFWLNIGDTYSSFLGQHGNRTAGFSEERMVTDNKKPPRPTNIPQKCLLMMPEKLAFACLDIGFILRNKIVWFKPNHMPSSVKDRFSNAWEYVYFFSKSKKYFFDLDAAREPHKEDSFKRANRGFSGTDKSCQVGGFKKEFKPYGILDKRSLNPSGKNPGDVFLYDFWTITTQPFPEAHFAVFPEKLCEKPILAGCPAQICKKCRFIKERITKNQKIPIKHIGNSQYIDINSPIIEENKKSNRFFTWKWRNETETLGWTSCNCNAGFEPGIVLDPFCGSGTALVVAKKLGRNFIGIDIKPEYIEMAKKRLEKIPEKLTEFITVL